MTTLCAEDMRRDLAIERDRITPPAPDLSDLAALWNAGETGRRLALQLAAVSAASKERTK